MARVKMTDKVTMNTSIYLPVHDKIHIFHHYSTYLIEKD